ncbi:hypothetical protein GCM10008909_04920 [Hathewaya limosa]
MLIIIQGVLKTYKTPCVLDVIIVLTYNSNEGSPISSFVVIHILFLKSPSTLAIFSFYFLYYLLVLLSIYE